jgi:ribosome biogenesis GTPase A
MKSKKLILVLNKIDLVPLPVIYEWKKILELEFPTVLFKGST